MKKTISLALDMIHRIILLSCLKTISLVLVLALGLTLFCSVATGGIVFLDDFEDGSATDGAPVTWWPLPGGRGSFEVIDGNFVLTRPTDNEEMYSFVNQYTLADTSIRTQARLIGTGAWWLGLLVRGNAAGGAAGGTAYIVLLFNNGRLEIWRFGPSFWILAGADVGIDPRVQDVLLRFDVIGNELSAWAWREGDPMPAEPQVTTVHSEWATGVVGIAADLGWRLSNNDAIFEVVPLPGATILEYQWYEISGGSYIQIGNNATTLTIPNMQAEDKGREFFCRVITDKGPFYSRNAAICHVDYNLRLVEDFEALSGSVDGKAATGASGGKWDTHGEGTANVGVISKNYSHVLQYCGHSGGSSRGAMVSGLSNPIKNYEAGLLLFRLMLPSGGPANHYMGITDLNLNMDPDAMDGSACQKEKVVAGFGVLSVGNSPDEMDVVTTDETATVLARIIRDQWYNIWIVADNTNDTYDLYLSTAEGPGTPIPGRPLAKDLIGEGLAFGKRTTSSLYGAMFFTETTTGGTVIANIDDIYWSAP